MMEEKDEKVESSPTPDEEVVESSTTEQEEAQVSEPTELQGPEKEAPFHEHPRFQELREKASVAEQRAMDLETKYHEVVGRLQQPQTKPTTEETDIISKYGAQDPATREFLRDMKTEMRREANIIADERAAPIIRENEALRRTVATIQEKQFRVDNKDVVPGSKEELEIAQYVQMGMPLEKATKAVMFDKRVDEARKGGAIKQTTKVKTKVNANLETASVPESSGLPQNRTMNFKDDLRYKMDKAGL